LLPPIASDEEVDKLKQLSQLNVERVRTKFTAIGNLIAVNDNGAIVSPLFKGEIDHQIQDVLGVPAHSMTVGGFVQSGALIVATNVGAGIHPKATEEEIEEISEVLQVPSEAVTVNGGVPFLSSGIVANSKAIVVGNLTSGPELIMLSRIFKA
jgi:translation initiation factor 6